MGCYMLKRVEVSAVEIESLVKLAVDAGVMVALVVFFVLRSSKIHDAMSARLTEVENFQREELKGMVKETTTALAQSTHAVDNSTQAITDTGKVMEKLCSKIDGISPV